MGNTVPFGEILEAAETLTLEDQETLIEILNRRMIDRRRAELAKDIEDAQREFDLGSCRPVTPEEVLREILS